jgi:hypothetical protein
VTEKSHEETKITMPFWWDCPLRNGMSGMSKIVWRGFSLGMEYFLVLKDAEKIEVTCHAISFTASAFAAFQPSTFEAAFPTLVVQHQLN